MKSGGAVLILRCELASPLSHRQRCPRRFRAASPTQPGGLGGLRWPWELPLPPPCTVWQLRLCYQRNQAARFLASAVAPPTPPTWPYLSIRHPVQGTCWSRRRGAGARRVEACPGRQGNARGRQQGAVEVLRSRGCCRFTSLSPRPGGYLPSEDCVCWGVTSMGFLGHYPGGPAPPPSLQAHHPEWEGNTVLLACALSPPTAPCPPDPGSPIIWCSPHLHPPPTPPGFPSPMLFAWCSASSSAPHFLLLPKVSPCSLVSEAGAGRPHSL